jgi:subtilisin family serine protease
MGPLELVKLTPLMQLTSGKPEIVIGLIDGPVAINHPDLVNAHIHSISESLEGTCAAPVSSACMHGTFVAGILCASRNSPAPAICPGCTLLVRPIFTERIPSSALMPSSTPEELATAIIDCIDAGAHLINMSVALSQPSTRGHQELEDALDFAAKRGVIVVVAAGNQGTVGSSVITRHPWVVPVIACDSLGRPVNQSNLGSSIGRRGLGAPGDNITSLGAEGKPIAFGGTSAAAPFVTGSVALLWSAFPDATAAEVKLAMTQAYAPKRTSVVPPLLDAWAAYHILGNSNLAR